MCRHADDQTWQLDLLITTPEGYEGGRETIRLCNACMVALPDMLAAWHRPLLHQPPAREPVSARARENIAAAHRARQEALREERGRADRRAYEMRLEGASWSEIAVVLSIGSAEGARNRAKRHRMAHDLPALPNHGPTTAAAGRRTSAPGEGDVALPEPTRVDRLTNYPNGRIPHRFQGPARAG